MAVNIAELIHKGGVFSEIAGSNPEDVYKFVTEKITLPEGITSEIVYNSLCSREKIMSTAVGNGIALPHARLPLLKDEGEQRICVVYLKNPLDMNAPDERHVNVMFIILSATQQTHLEVLSALVKLFQKTSFKRLLDNHANEAELLNSIRDLS